MMVVAWYEKVLVVGPSSYLLLRSCLGLVGVVNNTLEGNDKRTILQEAISKTNGYQSWRTEDMKGMNERMLWAETSLKAELI